MSVVLHRKNEFRKVMTPRRSTMKNYEYLFLVTIFHATILDIRQ